MKRFHYKTFLYALPLLLVLSFSYVVLRQAGELSVVSEAGFQEKKLTGLAYSDQSKDYKLQEILRRKPKVLAIGTSRILQVRDFFFKNKEEFYNGGRVMSRIGELSCLQEEFTSAKYAPELIILSLDQNFFNKRWDDLHHACEYHAERSEESLFSGALVKMYTDIFDGKIDFRILYDNSSYEGLNAIMNHTGFRVHDGSYYYGKVIENFRDSGAVSFQSVEKRIRKGNDRFEWGAEVNPEAVEVLKSFIAFCRQRDIALVMFFPPYPTSIYDKMVGSGKYGYLLQLDSVMTRQGIHVHNFSSLETLEAKDSEALDGYHASEVAYLRLIVELCGRGERELGKYVDKDQFRLLEAPVSPLELKKEVL